MIEKSASGQIALRRDPTTKSGNHPTGHFTLDGLEEFCAEARMAGVEGKATLWSKSEGSLISKFYFTTTDQFVIQAQGKQIVYKTNYLPYVLALALLVLAVVGWIL